MSSLARPTEPARACVVGLDVGSSYVKAVSLPLDSGARDANVLERHLARTGYDYAAAAESVLGRFSVRPRVVGVTGFGKSGWHGAASTVRRTEISSLAKGMNHFGFHDGTLVDIGGQDSKVIRLERGRLAGHAMNRRCAAGTGAYLEFIAYRLNLDVHDMNEIASREQRHHPINSYCTVFASTEILDCVRQNIAFPSLIRGLYASVVQRVREIAPLHPPLFLSGGVAEHHPVLLDVFRSLLKTDVQAVPDPQFLAALGIALYAREQADNDSIQGEDDGRPL